MDLKDRDELLEQSIEYFYKTFSKKGKLKINRDIHNKIEFLQQAFEMETDEIFQILFEGYLKKKLYEKYQQDRALSTFISHYVNYGLNDLQKKQKTSQKRFKGIPLNNPEDVATNFPGEDWIAPLIEFTTPEDLVLSQELMELVFKHFGALDALVLLGYEDSNTVAESHSLSYDGYRKRLLRKKLSFIQVLEEAGYSIH